MPTTNRNLLDAKANEDNEFYTRLPDIENELKHYKRHFKGKIVYCNCDDPLESNFFIYFVKNFKKLGLKKLITTCYDGSPVAGTQLELPFEELKTDPKRVAHKIVVTDVTDFSRPDDPDEEINFWDVKDALLNGSEKARLEKLEGDKKLRKGKRDGKMYMYGGGDFRSEECVELLKEADIVVTNPPFSLFKEYVPMLMEYEKKFLIIGRLTIVANEDIFPYVKARTVWCGVNSGEMKFNVPADAVLTPTRSGIDENGQKWKSMGNAFWLTNLEPDVKIKPLQLTAKYTSKEYPKFEHYDAIYIGKGKGIPKDYNGVMGVPTTFFPKICPEQFDIVGCSYAFGRPDFWDEDTKMNATVKGEKEKVRYLLIRKKVKSAK